MKRHDQLGHVDSPADPTQDRRKIEVKTLKWVTGIFCLPVNDVCRAPGLADSDIQWHAIVMDRPVHPRGQDALRLPVVYCSKTTVAFKTPFSSQRRASGRGSIRSPMKHA
ncbi:hypothetical protein L596_001459 [Steinernema carpocapsae]|uniref:Uncharacterized protein n=1 Tax=Steinernema carpocapsae TaxID=34508 RepID=A0A4U8ULU8_STECR|nr:hypothetical protein L596_001459 [Steinernema carpocapsae]